MCSLSARTLLVIPVIRHHLQHPSQEAELLLRGTELVTVTVMPITAAMGTNMPMETVTVMPIPAAMGANMPMGMVTGMAMEKELKTGMEMATVLMAMGTVTGMAHLRLTTVPSAMASARLVTRSPFLVTWWTSRATT
jgi:hypothetical protein